MSKLNAYNFYQNTTSPTASLASTVSAAKPATASAAVIEISDAARQAAGQLKAFPSTNTIWGSGPRQ